MKGLAKKLTEDNLVIKNYVILASGEKHHTHTLLDLPQELCEELADKNDKGYGYMLRERYFYTCNGKSKTSLGLPFLTAKGVVQRVLWDHFGDVKYLKIIKIEDNEKDNSISEKAVEKV